MATQQEPWFVAARSEALAGLLLTSRDDVRVLREDKTEDGVDFMVGLSSNGKPSTRHFMVQVRGTADRDTMKWVESIRNAYQAHVGEFFLPTCLFLMSIRENRAYYCWIAEPQTEGNSAKLLFHHSFDLHDLDKEAVDRIVQQVKAWYDVLPAQLFQRDHRQ
jgi:hypothetical protein